MDGVNLDLSAIKTVHFTGIKGVGMTALACIAKDFGMEVTGSDTADEFVTDKTLQEKGISWTEGFDERVINETQPDLVIYTAAHQGEGNPQVQAAQRQVIPTISLGEALGLFQQTKTGVSVIGVGGKTTTSAMLATVLEQAKQHPSYMVGVGGVSSLEYPGRYDATGSVFVAEADEYACSPVNRNPKFYYQYPKVIILTNLAFDHPDIYKNEEETIKTFAAFVNKLPDDGVLIANLDCEMVRKLLKLVTKKVITYGENEQAQHKLTAYRIEDNQAVFSIVNSKEKRDFELRIPGLFNAKNAIACVLAASLLGLSDEQIQKGLLKFLGTKRRFEKVAHVNSVLLYDDYAHHPDEIKLTLAAAKQWFSHKKILAIFQPHTYSRTKSLFSEFTRSFDSADRVIIADIFASAREKDDPTINSRMLVEEMQKSHQSVSYAAGEQEVLAYLESWDLHDTVIFTLGAGDVYMWNPSIQALLKTYA